MFALTPLQLRTLGFKPQGGARGQNLELFRISDSIVLFFSFKVLFVFEQQVLFKLDFLCGLDLRA